MNLFKDDLALSHALKKHMDPAFMIWAEQELGEFHKLCYQTFDERAVHTDREGQPKLIKYNKFGDDISHIWVNEGYRQTVAQTYNKGIVGYVHKDIPELGHKGNYTYSFAQGYLLSQVEPGFYCPVTLTMAVAYLLDNYADDELKAKFLPHVISTGEVELYEGATFLTERQGGSDVGANETVAVQVGDHYQLSGEKYFASNAGMCGVATVLARIEGAKEGTKGLSLFLVPWKKDDGTLNNIQVRRLKDKLGVRAVPSAEVVLDKSNAYLIGDPTRGFYYMMEALNLSRVCNAFASVGIMRRAYVETRNYAAWRSAFGQKIINYPMVKNTLVNLLARQEVQTSALFTLVQPFEKIMSINSQVSNSEQALNRLLIALLKSKTAEEAIDFAHAAIEMHGGNGYIEDFVTPRLLRDAQVLTVWEGTANILALEVLRLISKFRAHELFIDLVDREIKGLPHFLQKDLEGVNEGIKKLKSALEFLAGKDTETQTYHAKQIANLMTDIYLSVVSLKDVEIEKDRKHLIAKVFNKHVWNRDIIDDDMLEIHHFNEIIFAHESKITSS